MQVGQFPSIHLSSNWRSLQRMLAFQQWHKHKHTHTHTFFGTVLRRKKTGTSHRYVLNAVITWAPEWGQTCCIKIMLVTFFSGHRFQEHLWNSFKSYGFTYRHRTPASLPSKHYCRSWRRTNLETQHQRANISFDKKTTVKRNHMGDRNLTTKIFNKQS